MPIRRRAPFAAVLAALLANLPGAGTSALAATAPVAPVVAPADAVTSAPKVVIVVGAVEATTASYRTDADSLYAEAIKYTPNVVKVYSPNATWAAVQAAAQGASIFIYLGHGYGFPSPYKPMLTPSVHDGMGLNEVANNGDSDKKYYGESVVSAGIKLAKNAIVILDHLCYAAGSGEPGMAIPALPVAKQRVDNFASGFLRAGARAVMADNADTDVISMIRSVFTTHQTIVSAWHAQYLWHHNDLSWQPLRNPAYTATMDPETPTGDYHRSLVTDPAMTTDDIVAGAAAARTDVAPSALQAPGAATVGAGPVSLTADASLTGTASTTLAAGTKVRVAALSTSPDAAQVATLDGKTTGWTATGGLVPADSASPQLWSLDGPTTVTPNFDGATDYLRLVARFSESVSWRMTISDPSSNVLATLAGSGEIATMNWSPLDANGPLPAGDYGYAIHAVDAWGNAPLDTMGVIHVQSVPVPATGVPSFAPTTTMTNASSVTFNIAFAGPVTGLTASDFTAMGSATSCVVGAPTGSGTTYAVVVSGCTSGTLTMILEPKAVSDGTNLGPAGLIGAHSVVIDRTVPTSTAPTASLRSGVSIGGSSLSVSLGWTAADSGGSGLASYQVGRSVDGGAYAVIASGLTSMSYVTTMTSGHTYKFEVRAKDRAGNLGAWHAGPTLTAALVQQTSPAVTWSGSWATVTNAADSGGSARTSSSAGATASYTFGGRAVSVVLDRCVTCGAVRVYVDGVLRSTVDTVAASPGPQWVAYSIAFSSWGSHTVKLVVVGTTGRPSIFVDAFEAIT